MSEWDARTGLLLLTYLLPVGTAVLFAALPWLSRPQTWFAVTVEADFRDSGEGRAVLRLYLVLIAASCLVIVAGLVGALHALGEAVDLEPVARVGATTMGLAGLAAFIHCRRRVLRHGRGGARVREVEIEPAPSVRQVLPGQAWVHVVPYLVVLLPAAWVALNYAAVPDPTVVNVGPGGANYAPRTFWTVFGGGTGLLGTLLLCHLFMLIPLYIRRLPDHVARARGINLILLHMMVVIGLMGGYMSLLPLYGAAWVEGGLGMSVLVGGTLLVLVVPVITGFRVLRQPGRHGAPGDRSPDDRWLLGLIYFNPEDPALWVEQRFGVGYTANFAHPLAWLLLVLLVLLVAGGLILA